MLGAFLTHLVPGWAANSSHAARIKGILWLPTETATYSRLISTYAQQGK